jgi:biopolymer transport protein ExbD
MRIRMEEEEPIEVQMAPLIDCVFLLLIFFLVATTLKKVDRELPLDLPQAAASVESQVADTTLIIGVDRMGVVHIGAERVTLSMLHDRLKEAAATNKSQRVRIDADRATAFQDVVHVLDLCQFEGLTNVGLHTRKEDQR